MKDDHYFTSHLTCLIILIVWILGEFYNVSDSLTVENMFSLVPERTNQLIKEYRLPPALYKLKTTVSESDVAVTESYTTVSQEVRFVKLYICINK